MKNLLAELDQLTSEQIEKLKKSVFGESTGDHDLDVRNYGICHKPVCFCRERRWLEIEKQILKEAKRQGMIGDAAELSTVSVDNCGGGV